MDLTVGYRRRRRLSTVLENVNLTVAPGELVCLLGPNGTGKSTLLRTISKIQPPLRGAVRLGGLDLRRLRPMDIARRLGVVLTDRVAIGAMPAYRVVELGRYPHLGWSGRLDQRGREVVAWALAAVNAEHLTLRDSNELSDGERQRIMIARALAQEPLMLLLDEPTAFLDVPSRVELMALLGRLAQEEGLAVVVSTHDLELALRMADTVWLVTRDRRLHCGAPEDLVLAGCISEAFAAEGIRFLAEERAFRPTSGRAGRADVRGVGLHATLAAAVLERQGFELHAANPDICVTVHPDGTWSAVSGTTTRNGSDFASLASLAAWGR